ncbi:MAG TPA: hypothetical protein VFV66_30895 [Nonomuraea sp.]|nr:hypothetical protein [Nonomuraea sp.]
MTILHHDLDSPYDLDSAAVRHFAENGFVKLPGVLDPATIAAYEPEITSKVIELNTQHLPLAERDTYGKAFLQVTNGTFRSDACPKSGPILPRGPSADAGTSTEACAPAELLDAPGRADVPFVKYVLYE